MVKGKRQAKVPISKAHGDKNSVLWCEQDPVGAYQWAKVAWFAGETVVNIWCKTGFPEWRLNSWIYGYDASDFPDDEKGWKEQREELEKKLMASIFKSEKERYHRLLGKMLSAMERGVDHLLASNEFLTPKDISSLSTASKGLYEMIQLELGKPTQIVGRAKVTREQILEKLKKNDLISYDQPDKGKPEIVN